MEFSKPSNLRVAVNIRISLHDIPKDKKETLQQFRHTRCSATHSNYNCQTWDEAINTNPAQSSRVHRAIHQKVPLNFYCSQGLHSLTDQASQTCTSLKCRFQSEGVRLNSLNLEITHFGVLQHQQWPLLPMDSREPEPCGLVVTKGPPSGQMYKRGGEME